MAKPIKFVKTLQEHDPNNLMKEIWFDWNCITVNDFVDWSTLSGEVETYFMEVQEDE